MANSVYKTRTNYVRVTDENEFKRIIGLCNCTDSEPLTLITKDIDGETHFGFCVEGDINGYLIDENDNIVDPNSDDFDEEADYDTNYDRFIDDIQSVIAPGDALIITTIGCENMRWLSSCVTVITCDARKTAFLSDVAYNAAQTMLGDNTWTTEMWY